MKTTLLFMMLTFGAVSAGAQTDWSGLFPEIPGCRKIVYQSAKSDNVVEWAAEYKVGDRQCGSIVLRREANLFRNRKKSYAAFSDPTFRWTKVKNFDAIQGWALCGNDDFVGSIEVFFKDDMSMSVGANRGYKSILDYAQNANYGALGLQMKQASAH